MNIKLILYLFILFSRLCKKYTSNPVAVETGFTCPNLLNGQSANQSVENSSENLIYLCLSSLDEYLIPCVFVSKTVLKHKCHFLTFLYCAVL